MKSLTDKTSRLRPSMNEIVGVLVRGHFDQAEQDTVYLALRQLEMADEKARMVIRDRIQELRRR